MKAPSYLYVMQDGIGRVKIGYSMRPDQRRYGLGRDMVQKALEYDSSRSRLKALGLERVVTYRRKKR